MRVAIANDVPVAIEVIKRIVATLDWIEIVWIARNGVEAVAKAAADRPDVILMDLQMPQLDGVKATAQIMAQSPCAILIVTVSMDENRQMVFDALGAGALDAVNTPMEITRGGGEGLVRKLEMVCTLLRTDPVSRGSRSKTPDHGTPCKKFLAIGASAGGPAALATFLASLGSADSFAVAIVQHVDYEFAKSLAEWLNDQSPIPVSTAEGPLELIPNRVVVATTHDHLVMKSNGMLGIAKEPAHGIYRPSIDVFFSSVAQHWRGKAVGLLMTGMGRDGAAGLLEMKKAGHHTIAQDQASCAVYGMPKAAVTIGAATQVLALDDIAKAVHRQLD